MRIKKATKERNILYTRTRIILKYFHHSLKQYFTKPFSFEESGFTLEILKQWFISCHDLYI